MSGSLGNVQIHVELEPEQIREQSWLMKHTVVLALDSRLRLKYVTRIHAKVMPHKLLTVCPTPSVYTTFTH